MKLLIATVALMVTRDPMTILPVTVPEHEVEIQKAVFGEDNVEILETKTEPIELDPAGEAERLQAKYGPDALEKSYGVNYKGAIAKAAAAAAIEGAAGGAKALAEMTKAELLAEAEKRGVQVDASKTKAEIQAAIEGAAG